MERFVIVMPVNTSAYLLPCDDGDTCKLEAEKYIWRIKEEMRCA